MKNTTLPCCKLILLLVFLLLTSLSFSQNANLVISGNGVPIANNDITPSVPDNTDFGTVTIGNTLNNTFVLTNTGIGGTSAARRITFANPSVVISGVDAGQFSIVSGPAPGNTLNGLGTVFSPNLIIRFTPTLAAGTKNATVTVRYTNNGGTLTYNFAIKGISLSAPEINIQGNATTIVDGDLTPSIADWTTFGSISIGVGLPRTFTIQNTGSVNLTIGAITFSGLNAADFAVTTAPSATVAPGGSTTVVVTFTPSSIGVKTADISIANNDSNENPYNFSIQGTGIQNFFDSDGDGIFDDVDIDDDNDGIRDITEEVNCNISNGPKVNYKFLNETFGTGPRTTINTTYNAITTYCHEDGIASPNTVACPNLSDISLNDGEYTVGSSAQIASWAPTYWYMGKDHTGDVNGRMAIFNASFSPGIFYTASITGALPNVPITYSFWVINIDRTDAPGIATRLRPNVRVEFRDTSNNLLTAINTGAIAPTTNGNLAGDWYQFTANLNLNVTAFNVIFINNETGGLGNDLALDDILISQTLCDLDNDGVADVFDLDADNDGVEDIIEAGFGNLSNAKGRMDVAWLDVNANGLNDTAEGVLTALDSDSDGIPNYIDLDSDNDSLFDVDESGAGNINAALGFVNGDGDITGDGRGDGPESETFRSKDVNGDGITEGFGDGILDIYDYGTNIYGNLDQGTLVAPFLNYTLDTDADGTPDYIDTTSNGASFDIASTLYASLDGNNDGIIDGATDIDKDGITDTFDTNTTYFGSPRDLNRKLFLDFDGRNDYGQSTAILGGLTNASLMAWINLNSAFSTEGIIIGQDKFQLRINSNKELEAVVNGTTLTHKTTLNTSQWHHVAAVYGGGFLKLYLNGALVEAQAVIGNITADVSLLTLGKNPIANTKYFKGKIDEVRVFNVALTDSQLQRMVYQEIQNTGAQVRGTVIPKDIGTLPFANLLRYYRMDAYKDDIIDDLTTPAIDMGTGMEIYNHKNIYVQQAPMPFITERTGDFATAVNSPAKEIRGLDIMDYDWSIVNVKHDIAESFNNTDLGMFLDPTINIVMNNDNKIQNDWYLKLDGKIDLQGKSQLVQTVNSDLDTASTGSIERDQQGQSNIYNYNYWSSPVSPIGFANNSSFTVDSVFKDGTTSTPQNINWIGGYDGIPSTPISLANYWIFKFQNVSGAYANWTAVGQNGSLLPAQGFTLKGSGSLSGNQNYTFVGKPFNGDLTSPIAANNLNLSGNPYASSIDANKFIDDNVSSLAGVATTTGTIYFWEHSSSNNTHNLADYQGGYAAYTKTGGTPPVAPAGISGLGGNTKIAKRFIPVGQGFFVVGSTTGGNVVFNNSQRTFVKEDDASSFQLFRTSKKNIVNANRILNNNSDPYEADTFPRVRLGFNSNNKYHRQILLGFMDENATNRIDPGYDAIHIDDQPNDMYFITERTKLTIQGVGRFNKNKRFPLEIKTAIGGNVQFVLDSLENFDSNQKVFIYDKVTNMYHNIKNHLFEVSLPIGTIENRFYLCFKNNNNNTNKTMMNDEDLTDEDNIQVMFTNYNHFLNIRNITSDTLVSSISLFNILGQFISKWEINNEEQTNIQIPIQNLSPGTYIAKIKTTKGDLSQKIIVE
jgi:hypothetical protein